MLMGFYGDFASFRNSWGRDRFNEREKRKRFYRELASFKKFEAMWVKRGGNVAEAPKAWRLARREKENTV